MRAALLSSVLLSACTMVSPDVSEPSLPGRVLVDFAKPEEAGRWQTVLDGVMGGRSSGTFVVEDGRVVFTGVLNTNGGGFSSVRRPASDLGLGTEAETGIHLRVRGDGRTYTLRLRQPSPTSRLAASYRSPFATQDLRSAGDAGVWQDVFLPFADMVPTWRGRTLDLPAVDPGRVDEIGVSIDDKIDGPFQIELGEIRTYRAERPNR